MFLIAGSIMYVRAQDLSAPFCEAAIYEEMTELEDARNATSLNQSTFAAYEKIFGMIKRLREAQTIPEMDYIKAKYDRDASKLSLEQADLILERQSALVEQYRLICYKPSADKENGDRASAIRKAYLQYRRADCNSLAKGIEIAANNLEYNREYLKKISKLRDEKFANNTQVIMAELDVEHEEKNLADAKNRAGVCRAELLKLESEAKH
jgi:hypothetical protein